MKIHPVVSHRIVGLVVVVTSTQVANSDQVVMNILGHTTLCPYKRVAYSVMFNEL